MNGINPLGTSTARPSQANNQNAASQSGVTSPAKGAALIDTQVSRTEVSLLSRLLGGVATQAAVRDANTDRDGLAAIAESALDKIFGDNFWNNRDAHDAEVPNSEDPQRLALAKQATDYGNNKGGNPFTGLSRDQLALITYDESGTFTVNERRAAWEESYRQHEEWSRAMVAKIMDEYNRTHKTSSESHQEVLDYYKSLPAIEEAQLPKGYDMQLQALIQAADSNEPSQHKKELESLLEVLNKRLESNKQA